MNIPNIVYFFIEIYLLVEFKLIFTPDFNKQIREVKFFIISRMI